MTEQIQQRPKVVGFRILWFGIAMIFWPILAALLSGLLFAQGSFGMFIARVSYHLAFLLGTPSMLAGVVAVMWALVLLRKQKRQSQANVNE
ncbi:hypothetical protein [Ruegeria faecimaris]|uniref:hypothetical protein n=1 Tax=Ruegeria faecimaris TaxID=686389 RepID=UPI002491BABB|nr:hypothetical protein [Ruegeria faecimaris]